MFGVGWKNGLAQVGHYRQESKNREMTTNSYNIIETIAKCNLSFYTSDIVDRYFGEERKWPRL
jgi:hypothetical protein